MADWDTNETIHGEWRCEGSSTLLTANAYLHRQDDEPYKLEIQVRKGDTHMSLDSQQSEWLANVIKTAIRRERQVNR